ncbi:biotin--[acetyl-CoA-carboxylase] ligase [Bordetella tumulicola]|uniref:biotin--[acetyl-CoA-carboxylase] ligase n=1 Tax=Bordetella tumulicola TaxID=1649133 RepID=UPI0039F0F031
MLNDVRPIDLPTPQTLARELSARLDGFQDIAWTAGTGSTNGDLLARARQDSGTWLLGTHQQQAGRGRAGRPWQNRAGATLMFSCAYPVRMPAHRLPALSPLAGLIAGEALRSLIGNPDPLRVKWPNDLQWHDGKLAGILVESTRNLAVPDAYTVIVGIGINLSDAETLSQALGRSIADWATVTQHSNGLAVSVADIVCAVATAWRQAISQLETDGFAPFCHRFSAVDALAGRDVNIIDRGTVLFSGCARGLDEHGRLMVQTTRDLVPVSVGEISIRPRTAEQTP